MGKSMYFFARKIHFPTNWAIKPTVYEHFVGGSNLEDCSKNVAELKRYNVKSILDYSAEGGTGESFIKSAYDEIIKSIDYSAITAGVSYAVFKPSAMGYPKILEKFNFNLPTTSDEKIEYDKWVERLDSLAQRASQKGIRLLIDAEHYAYQQCIDDVCDNLMRKYNKERAVVFNTLQMYRHDRMDYLKSLHQTSQQEGFKMGIKFVRGAYMEEERALAGAKGYQDPICVDKQATDDNYNAGLKYCVENINDIEIFNGTHNAYSCQYLTELMAEHGIAKDDERIYSVQLFGMSDNLTYNLAAAGYNAAKYIPYAPVERVMPYLLRRAEENTSIAGQTNRELELLQSELKRRKSLR